LPSQVNPFSEKLSVIDVKIQVVEIPVQQVRLETVAHRAGSS